MSNFKGFWSYVHVDDQADCNRITRLARDVREQFQMQTGEEIALFLDKDSLEWGKNWREAIDSNLASVAFFVSVLTPRYFMSPECRRELQSFARQATNLGIKELVLPLLYVSVPELDNDSATDELIRLVRTFQWEDWREVRFLDVASEGYRRGVHRLSTRLADANRQAESMAAATIAHVEKRTPDPDADESLGVIDRLANAEEMLGNLPETTKAITEGVQLIGQIMQESTADIERANSQHQPFSARLFIARQMAARLNEPVENIWSLSNKFASQLHDIDGGVRTIIERAPLEISQDPDSKSHFCAFFGSILDMAAATGEAMEKDKKMLIGLEPLETLSRDIRPVLRRLRQGLTIQIEAMGISQEWAHLIESSDIGCDD